MKNILIIIILIFSFTSCYVENVPYKRKYLNVEIVYPNYHPYYYHHNYSFPPRHNHMNHNNHNPRKRNR